MKHTLSLVFALFVCLLTACEHKPLILPEGDLARVKIVLDWSEVNPDEIPENVTLNFYPQNGTRIETTLPSDTEEQIVVLPYNTYRLLVTTGAEEVTTSHPGTLDTHTITVNQSEEGILGHILGTPSTQYREPEGYPQPLGHALTPVFAAVIERVEVGELTPVTTVIVKPRRVTARYNIIVNNFKVETGLAKIWGGALSGLSGALLPGETLFADKCRPATPTPVMTQPFILNWDGGLTANATAYTFGTPDFQQRQLLYIYIWSDQNGLLAQPYDVTDIIANAPDPMNVDIIIDFLGFSNKDDAPYAPNVSGYEEGGTEEIIM